VLILLPPSEGKTAPDTGPRLALAKLSFPELTATRTKVLDALTALCDGPAAKARTSLGISARQGAELERNRALRTSPTAPAGEVYSGVLYDALDLATLGAKARARAASDIAICSALFGLLRVTDAIPAYRLSADTTLPRLGRLATVWREPLAETIEAAAGKGVVLDLRSSAYVALGPVPTGIVAPVGKAGRIAQRTAVARVLQEKGGKRSIVSHHNKATKGRIVRALLGQPTPRTVEAMAGALGAAGYRVELEPPRRDDAPWTLDVIVTDL
jgi:cytoplasmic iron level regulating protein YaaA (DUF328/UPF0246 family)